jgi:hypothetical protein
VLTESYVGLLATGRRQADGRGFNGTLGADTRLRLGEHFAALAQVTASYTREPNDTSLSSGFADIRFGKDHRYDSFFNGERFGGIAMQGELDRNGRHVNATLTYQDFSPTFRAETGFITANDYRLLEYWSDYMVQLDGNRFIDRVEPQVDAARKYNYDGVFKDTWVEPQVWLRFTGQTTLWTGYLWSEERFADHMVRGIARWSMNIDSNFSKFVNAGGYANIGHSVVRDRDNPRLGDETSYGAYLYLMPTPPLRLDLTYDRFGLSELHSGPEVVNTFVTRGKLTYQFTKNMFLRVIGEYVDDQRSFSIDPLLSYKINPFTVFFVGSSHSFNDFRDDPSTTPVEVSNPGYRQTERLFFVKFQYLFRV